ncbi:hypothetical protein D3C78_899560 [compost metagenome]
MPKLEERYLVVKLKRITVGDEWALRYFLEDRGIPTEECVVVESDWPIYNKVVGMVINEFVEE